MSYSVDIGYTTQAGARSVNEDFAGAMLPESGLEDMGVIAAIADGLSAGGLGRDAAQTTVTSLVRDYYGTPQTWEPAQALERIITAQNAWLAAENRRRKPAAGLCTLTALALRGRSYTLAHVGDTRAYLLRDGQVTQLTLDHVMPHPELRQHLLRSVGAEDRLAVDCVSGELRVGDVFILTSAGAHGYLRLRHLAEAAELPSAQVISDTLVQAALRNGSADNATVLVVRVLGLLEPSWQDWSRTARELPVPVRLQPGAVLDGLRVRDVMHDDGVHLVYRVTEERTQTEFALKTLHPTRAHDVQECALLAHEAWLTRGVQMTRAGQHLVALHEGPPGGRGQSAFYLLYDAYAGVTLAQRLASDLPIPQAQALHWTQQALTLLAGLHARGIVVRDLQPARWLIGADGVLRLLDLGAALSGREPPALRALHESAPTHVSPEQWACLGGEPTGPDIRGDLYALGVTLYQMLTRGRLPYGEVLPRQCEPFAREPLPPSRHEAGIPSWLDALVLRAVARDPLQRPASAEAVADELERGMNRPLPHAIEVPQESPPLAARAGFWCGLFVASALLNVLLLTVLLLRG